VKSYSTGHGLEDVRVTSLELFQVHVSDLRMLFLQDSKQNAAINNRRARFRPQL